MPERAHRSILDTLIAPVSRTIRQVVRARDSNAVQLEASRLDVADRLELRTMGSDDSEKLTHGYWFVAYIDLMGIRRALLSTDFISVDDPAKAETLIASLKESVGAILRMRKWLEKFFEGRDTADPDGEIFAGLRDEQVARAVRMRRARVRRDRISDGILIACSLPNPTTVTSPFVASTMDLLLALA